MVRLTPLVLLTLFLLVRSPGPAPAATQAQIDEAVAKGVDFLKKALTAGPAGVAGGAAGGEHGIGPMALAGIALIEAKVPNDDPVLRKVIAAVRDASYTQTQTYQISLCLLFLDKYEDPADVPLIQMLAARLLGGQNNNGGWTYKAVDVNGTESQALRAGLATVQLVAGKEPGPNGQPVPPMHPLVLEYLRGLMAKRAAVSGDDNSNTQFGILAVWAARKHGVPVEDSLNLISARFRQYQVNGAWAYTLSPNDAPRGSMTCAGLLGLATSVARYEEKKAAKAKAAPPPPPPEPKAGEPKGKAPPKTDPFFGSAPEGSGPAKKEKKPEMDPQVAAGLFRLGGFFVEAAKSHAGLSDLYFLWSVERVGVIFNVTNIGGLDWYAVGADYLVKAQQADGSWRSGGHSGPQEAMTAFAVLFLVKANLARDLSRSVTGNLGAELRAGESKEKGGADPGPAAKAGKEAVDPLKMDLAKPGALPPDESARMAAAVAAATGPQFKLDLERIRDAKGAEYTKALVGVVDRVDGERKKMAREALADRLTRMSAETLKGMLKAENPEQRRGAAVAAAQREERALVPDLIDRLTDDEDLVARAAKAGLESLTGQKFGPKFDAAGAATKGDKKTAADAWKAWWAKQPK